MSKGHKERKIARSRKKQETRQERALLIVRRQQAKKLAKTKEAGGAVTDLPIMPVYVERLLADTDHLTNEEFGAYTRLLFGGWLRKGVLEVDDLPRLAHESRQKWPVLWRRLEGFFCDRGAGKVGQKMLTLTYENAQKNHAANRVRTAKARAEKAKKNKQSHQNDRTVTAPVTTSVTGTVTEPVTSSYPNNRSTLTYQSESTSVAKPAKSEPAAQEGSHGLLAGRSPPSPSEASHEPTAPEMEPEQLAAVIERNLQRIANAFPTKRQDIPAYQHKPWEIAYEAPTQPDDDPEPGRHPLDQSELPQPERAPPDHTGPPEPSAPQSRDRTDEPPEPEDEGIISRALRLGKKP